MKTLMPYLFLAALAVGGWLLWNRLAADQEAKAAETRVVNTLKALQTGDDQKALCLWSVGLGVCNDLTMRRYTDEFDHWLRENGIASRPQEFRVLGIDVERHGNEVDAIVKVTVDGKDFRVVVHRDVPIGLR